MPEPQAPTINAPSAEEKKGTAKSPIQLGKSLSSQTAALTKILEDKPKEEPKIDESVKKPESKPEEPDEPETVPLPLPEEDEPAPKPIELGEVGKYILDRLPTLTTRIKDGEGVKTISFKDVSELPAGFELADDAARTQFTVDVAAQVGRAKDALTEFKQAELNENIRQFEVQQARDVAADVAWLQRNKQIEPFKYKEDDERFNDDPAVKVANEIYKIFEQTNAEYAKKYAGTNRTFRISYRDAADKYFAQQARTANDSQKAADQPKEVKKEKTPAQKEREEVAKQTGAPSGGEPSGNKPTVRSGMRMDDINRLVRMGKI